MSLFSRGFSRRKRSSSPTTNGHDNGDSHVENGNLPLRSRGGQSRSNNPVLPLTHANTTKTSTVSSNSFLLGGMYVPDKDKKFRQSPRFRTKAHANQRVYRFRVTAILVDLWQRLWWTSPVLVVSVACVLVVLTFYSLVAWRHNRASTLKHPHRLRYGNEWLATDAALLDLLPSVREERRQAEKRATERDRIRHLQHNERFATLEALAPKWFHRNDIGEEPVPPKTGRAAAATPERITVAHLPKLKPKIGGSQSTGQQHKDSLPTKRRLARTLQTMEKIPNYSHCPMNLSEADVAVTLVVQSSLDRVWILDETCTRWKAPIVVVVAVQPDERLNATRNLTGWRDKCPQLNLIVHHLDQSVGSNESSREHYPVNMLRNLALDAVQTSHVLVVDVDFVPSTNLHDTIQSILRQPPPNDKQAVVVPAFQRNVSPPCMTVEECKRHLRSDTSFIPSNFDDLKRCHDTKDCSIFQSNVNWEGHSSTRTHDWLERKWYTVHDTATTSDGQTIRSIPCFDSLRYEPYVVIRWCPNASQAASQSRIEGVDYEHAANAQNNRSTDLERTARPLAPYYDERFYGYGKNKIQHISHLRLLGYTFAVLPEGFIVHNPHMESTVKQTWNDASQKLHRDMDLLYRNYLRELVDKYFATHGANVVDQCSRDQAR